MKKIFKGWGILSTVASLFFLAWLFFVLLGKEHSVPANIVGTIALVFSLASLFDIWRKTPTTDWSKLVDSSFPLLFVLILGTYFLEHTLGITWFPEAIVAYGTMLLAVATYQLGQTSKNENSKLIAENKRLAEENQKTREYERDLASKQRRLYEVQHWIEQVLEFKAKHSVIIMSQEKTGEEMFLRVKELPLLLSSVPYIRFEVQRLEPDLKSFKVLSEKHKKGLEALIKELSDIFTKELLNPLKPSIEPLTLQNIENNCVEVLSVISDLRSELKL